MAQQVLGGIGAVIGGIYGGPQGAQYGWMIGSAIGGAIDPQVIPGPRIGEIAQQTSQEGVPRPIIFGLSPPITGNIIDKGDPVIVRRKESQGKGGPKVETESVFRTYAIGVCEGPIGGFVRVWRNGILVYDVREDSLLTTEENNLFLEKARFFLGSFEQDPSPDLESLFGVGTTPAHQGTAYMVMADEDLTDMRGAIPQYVFQVSRSGAGSCVLAVEKQADVDPWTSPVRDGSRSSVQLSGIIANEQSCDYSSDNESIHDLVITEDAGAYSFRRWTRHFDLSGNQLDQISQQIETLDNHNALEAMCVQNSASIMGVRKPSSGISADVSAWYVNGVLGNRPIEPPEGGDHYHSVGGSANFISGMMLVPDVGVYVRNGNTSSVWISRYPIGPSGPSSSPDQHVVLQNESVNNSSGGLIGYDDVGRVYAFRTGDIDGIGAAVNILRLAGDLSEILNTWVLPTIGAWDVDSFRVFCGRFLVAGPENDVEIYDLDDSLALLASFGVSGDANRSPRFVGQHRLYYQTAQELWTIASDSVPNVSESLASVITDLSVRVGLDSPKIDVSLIDEEVPGFAVTNTYPCTGALQALSQVFMFDPSNYDGVIHFVPRGADAALTITEDDMITDEIEQSKRGDAISVPRVLHLNYHDVAGGLATDKQTSERSGDRRATGEVSLQTAVVMNADEAAQVISINHKVMIEDQKGEIKFSLPDSFLGITVADIVIAEIDGNNQRLRVAQADTQDGYQDYVLVRDRQSSYTSDVEGIPAAPQTPPPSGIVGPTLIEPLDIHILRDADDSLSYYVAVSGVLAAWQGATIELSLDGGANYIDSQSWNASSVMGETMTVLADHPQAYPDEVNAVSVRIDTPLAELLETDLTGMLNRQNLAIIGDELIQFANADETSEGIWELSYFLRGRKGTATQEHAVDSRFVLLERNALAFVPANLTDIARTLTFRATSFGSTSGTVVSMVYGGDSQTERSPSYLQAHLDGTDAVILWQGVSRLGSGSQVAHGSNFIGYRVTISDGSLTGTFDTTDQNLTQDVSGYSAPLTISVQQRNNLTGLGPEIEVILQ